MAGKEYKKDASTEGDETTLFIPAAYKRFEFFDKTKNMYYIKMFSVVMLSRCEMFKDQSYLFQGLCFNESYVHLENKRKIKDQCHNMA